jgi:hypothetical protein
MLLKLSQSPDVHSSSTSSRAKQMRLAWSVAPLIFVTLAAGLCGCASVGHSFNNTAAENLDIGQMQSSDYRSVFGKKPVATALTTTADGRFEVARYSYAFADLGTAKARILILEFKDGKLNAFVYLSSFDEHQTHVPFDKINEISSRVSTKTDVLKVLGKPNGKALCPSTLEDFKGKCEKCVEIWTWQTMSSISTFGAAYGGKQPSIQNIYISFDKDGVVSEVSTSSTNSR